MKGLITILVILGSLGLGLQAQQDIKHLGRDELTWAAQQIESLLAARKRPLGSRMANPEWDDVSDAELHVLHSEITIQLEKHLSAKPVMPAQKATWRKKFTLGPGDQVNLSLYGKEGFERDSIPISPDGTISYLQAKAVHVGGLTLKETRIKLQDHLKEFHENTRVIISPAAINSKTFTIMGMVQNSGVFTMDREITALEAIARAGGIVTGVVNGNTQELADLKRSIIVRDGRPLKVDLEALLARGDLTQNIPLEPRDYVYIQPNLSNQYFLFGAVNKPGNQVMTPGATLVRALSENGGFADGAWRSKILLVRGSLDQPKSYIVDVAQVLKGKARDVQLETGDIVYVHTEPWHVIERILDNAIEAFLQSAVSTWVDIELFDIDPNATNEIDGSNNSSGSAP